MPFPNFIIAGERRCGTTTLANLLDQHPEVFLHPKRDSGWFIDDSVRRHGPAVDSWDAQYSPDSYAAWFAEAGAANQRAMGEKSADYFFWRAAHARMARFLPEVRLIITLRNPVDRAWSQYWNEVAKSREQLSFQKAIAVEPERLTLDDWSRYNLSYLSRGDYADSLKHLHEHFSPGQIKVITVESLRANPDDILRQICEFIGVDGEFVFSQTAEQHNQNWAVVPRPWAQKGIAGAAAKAYAAAVAVPIRLAVRDRTSRRTALLKAKTPFFAPARDQRMPSDIREQLTAYFQPRITTLEEVLGREIPEWRT